MRKLLCRSDLQWRALNFSVDIETSVQQLETVATSIVANVKLHPKWYGGDYRIFLTDAQPGFKLQLSVYYNDSHCGAPLSIAGASLQRGVL